MVKLRKKQDTVKVLSPTILEKAKKKKIWKEYEDKEGVLKEKSGDLSILQESLKNLLFINLVNSEKKEENFFYGDGRRINLNSMVVKQPKLWQYFGKIFPGVTSETEEGEIQAVNQWTGKPDYYDDGKPIMYPYVRCKLTDEIINATRNDAEVDHADGDRQNNTIENFTFVIKYANAAKAECTSYEEVDKKLSKIVATIRKYK